MVDLIKIHEIPVDRGESPIVRFGSKVVYYNDSTHNITVVKPKKKVTHLPKHYYNVLGATKVLTLAKYGDYVDMLDKNLRVKRSFELNTKRTFVYKHGEKIELEPWDARFIDAKHVLMRSHYGIDNKTFIVDVTTDPPTILDEIPDTALGLLLRHRGYIINVTKITATFYRFDPCRTPVMETVASIPISPRIRLCRPEIPQVDFSKDKMYVATPAGIVIYNIDEIVNKNDYLKPEIIVPSDGTDRPLITGVSVTRDDELLFIGTRKGLYVYDIASSTPKKLYIIPISSNAEITVRPVVIHNKYLVLLSEVESAIYRL